ncbi:MAG TPA: phosphatase PAP2 family protein [Solirubrobacteraceae bacterium]|nr:phosphatase PAP2 family protein [Solirubrobacteraceae bacterium]
MSRRPLFLLVLGALSAAAAAIVWLAAFVVPGGRVLDAAALRAFAGVARTPLEPSINGVAVLADPLPFVLAGALLVGVALLRRRPLMAAIVPVVLVGANACTQLLKPALADLRIIDVGSMSRIYTGSWPSGHATASMSLALCLILVVGPRLRPVAALVGAAYAIGVGYALVALGWHLPSDVLGGYLVAASFTLLGAAALAALETRRPVPAAPRAGPPATIPWAGAAASAAVLAALAALVLVRQHPQVATAAARHAETLVVASVIGALGLTLTAGLALALRR